MSIEKSTLEGIYQEMSELLSPFGKVVIAGGAVRDTLMGREPKDYDVFILDADREISGDAIKETLARLFTNVKVSEAHLSEPFLVSTIKVDGLVVQVMTSPHLDIDQLMASFDWNVCLFAYDGTFHAKTQLEDIAPSKDLVLQKVTFSISTMRRGFRFSERFGMNIPKKTLYTLCEKVLATKQNTKHEPLDLPGDTEAPL